MFRYIALGALVVLVSACTRVDVVQQSANVPIAGAPASASRPAMSSVALLRARAAAVERAVNSTDFGPLPRLNTEHRGTIPLLGRSFALPSGNWTVIELQRALHAGAPPTLGVALLRHEDTTLTGLFYIEGNRVARTGGGFPISPVCTSGNVIWSDVRSADAGGDQDCVAIAFQAAAAWRSSRNLVLRSAAHGLDLADVTPPPKLIAVSFAESDPGYTVFEELWLNPDLAGIAPDLSTQTARSAWAPYNLARDPAKQAYVARLEAWSGGWREIARAALGRSEDAAPADVATTP